ncbi:hypothetical protein [Xenorhabdus bovienii]|uniref:Uncharacterized protein n=1 Tax=Xenorhabdus bovienii TaxID=40576 RepID=A0A0B6XAP3_XENBV|nr:hypothetical protein [Xenorhabdus bovienii]CDM90231.1 protein of unknown function [Xenorhabdus bovienii]
MCKNETATTMTPTEVLEVLKFSFENLENDNASEEEHLLSTCVLELMSITLSKCFDNNKYRRDIDVPEYYQLTHDHLIRYASPTQPKRKTSRMDRREGNRSDAQNMARELLEARERLAQYENK